MKVLVIKKNKISSLVLPKTPYGSFWVEDTDKFGSKRNLINIDVYNGKWQIKSNYEVKLKYNGKDCDAALLDNYCFYSLNIVDEDDIVVLYCCPVFDEKSVMATITNDMALIVGSDPSSHICFNSLNINPKQLQLSYTNNSWELKNLNPSRLVYVNNYVYDDDLINNGDVIFIMGLIIIVIGNNIIINNPNGLVKLNINGAQIINVNDEKKDLIAPKEIEEDVETALFDKNEYFYRAPRFLTPPREMLVHVDEPPQEAPEQDTSALMQYGPTALTSIVSVFYAVSAFQSLKDGTTNFMGALPRILTCVVSLVTAFVWPSISKRLAKKQRKAFNKKRREKYAEYIDQKRNEVITKINVEKQVITETILPPTAVCEIIERRDRKLWERKVDHDDFLRVRLGIGDVPSPIQIEMPQEKFSMDEDDLRDTLIKLSKDTKLIKNVPITITLTQKRVSAIIGLNELVHKFLYWYILQILAFHSYEDLKIIVLTSEENAYYWNNLKALPHCWTNSKDIRFFGANTDEVNTISKYLDNVYQHRRYPADNNGKESTSDYKKTLPYYLIITDTFNQYKNCTIIKDVLNQTDYNYGFSLVIAKERMTGLPNECTAFINIDKNQCGIIENELSADKQNAFVADFLPNNNVEHYINKLCNVPIELTRENLNFRMPTTVSFLEMYNIGKVEQLNSFTRWQKNDVIQSLQAPVGLDENGDVFKLDLHEKAHGPHGLIAGMTGSGKSEFIITYVLSMAVNYHPDDVAFVLIDYKGGGLTSAFENRKTGLRIPHLVGTITNLDENEMNRALASIQSELKRRQGIFNKASELLGEGTVDIYKYHKLYKQHKVTEAVPHLFIISDEFAELKAQQPDFMNQLISAARIGRSLGIHLILATQKPSGVVNDQIWSNSRFRVCLKVQDGSDSKEMIKRDDAASLTTIGRFFIQVGFDELFALCQSAWCGALYQNTEKLKKKIDNTIQFINNVGSEYKEVELDKKIVEKKGDFGDELSNVVKYLNNIAQTKEIVLKKLWLDPIPARIFVKALAEKYNWKRIPGLLEPVIGEYDDPEHQKQGLVTVPLSTRGNTIIYGMPTAGKEEFLQTLIYSIIVNYYVDDVNMYIVDFGAETLKMFEIAPQVGDIVLSNESEKLENLFKLLFNTLEKRKKLFAENGGNFDNYCRNTHQKLPYFIIIINRYDILIENYQDFENDVLEICRDGFKYGIIIVMTTATINSIRTRLAQCFSQKFVLQLNDDSYSTLIPEVRRRKPSAIPGRGFYTTDQVYEFQTAIPLDTENLVGDIKEVCKILSRSLKDRAEKIRLIPEIVTPEFVFNNITDLSNVPVGLEKESIKTSYFNFRDDLFDIITGNDEDLIGHFIPALCLILNEIKDTTLVIVDGNRLFNEKKIDTSKYKYFYSKKFDDAFDNIISYVNDLEKYVQSDDSNDDESLSKCKNCVVVFNGFNNLLNSISKECKERFVNSFGKFVKYKDKITFVIADTLVNIKKLDFEPWYKSNYDGLNALWFGGGILDQYSIRIIKGGKAVRIEVPDDYGFVIRKGIPVCVKYLKWEDNRPNE